MLKKYKTSLLALAAAFSFSSFAAPQGSGFYVEVEAEDDFATEQAATFLVTFCPVDTPYVTCRVATLRAEHKTFISFESDTNAYVYSIQLPTKEDADATVITFEKPFKHCTVDPNTEISSTTHGKGYPLLEINYEEERKETEVTCETEIYWPKN